MLDDAYDPARLVSNNKEFVEKDEAIAVINFGGISIPARPAINEAGVAQIVQAGKLRDERCGRLPVYPRVLARRHLGGPSSGGLHH